MPPALNATGMEVAVGPDGEVAVAAGGTCVADVVVEVEPGVDCPVLVLPVVPAHAVNKIIITRTVVHMSIP